MEFRKARLEDVPQIRTIIERYSSKSKMLSRSLSYLYECIRDYYVASDGERILGCVSLHISWGDLGEIKSLAVDQGHVGRGIGKGLLEKALEEARAMGLPRVFTLTLEPEFFLRNGFRKVEKDVLPMKIWGECIQCPKYPECDETSLVMDL